MTFFRKCTFVLLFASIVLLVVLKLLQMALPLMQHNTAFIERMASRALHHPVHFKHVTLQWVGIDPSIELHGVTIENDAMLAQRSFLSINQLKFSINVFQSLWHWSLWPDAILLRGTKITLQQMADRHWQVVGIGQISANQAELSSLKNLLYWLATQSNIIIDHTSVMIHPYKGKTFLLQHAKLRVKNNHWAFSFRWQDFQTKLWGNVRRDNLVEITGKWLVRDLQQGGYPVAWNGRFRWREDQHYVLQLEKMSANTLKKMAEAFSFQSKALVEWVHHVKIKGDLLDVKAAFRLVQSEITDFKLRARLQHLHLKYLPQWPWLTEANGSLEIDQRQLTIHSARAFTQGNTLHDIEVKIADLMHPTMIIQGWAEGEVASALKFLQKSPLKLKTISTDLKGNGKIKVVLKIQQSLNDLNLPTEVSGRLSFLQNNLQLSALFPPLNHVQGDIVFHNDFFSATAITADLLGQPLQLQIVEQHKKPALLMYVQGSVNVTELLKKSILPSTAHVEGGFSYRGMLKIDDLYTGLTGNLSLISDLTGLSFNLLSSYKKTAQEQHMANVKLNFSKGTAADVKVEYKELLLLMARFNYLDKKLTFSSGELYVGKHAPIKNNTNSTLLIFSHDNAIGEVGFPVADKKGWVVNLHDIDLDFIREGKKQWQINPRDFPGFLFTCEACSFHNKSLGSLVLQTHKISEGLGIDAFKVTNKKYKLELDGKWTCSAKECHSTVHGKIINRNLGDFLRDWNLTDVVNEGYGETVFSLSWLGAPYKPSLAKMVGDVAFNYMDGRIIRLSSSTESKLGLGRLLNLLSLQSLPQNLLSGFTRIGKKGFEFSELKGKIAIKNGVGHSDKVELNGPLAWAKINGNLYFLRDQYDLSMKVVPNMTSSLPVIIGIAGGPVAGILSWLVNQVIAPKIGEVAAREYDIKGSMQAPSITQVKRS